MDRPKLIPLDRPELPPLPISDRLRGQLVYFVSGPDAPDRPELGENEYWFDRDEVAKWLDDGVIHLVSPLDSDNATEVELSEEQEDLLAWLSENKVRHARVG
ncbi:hypothetical protein [Paludisphaera sp.]|uniref:hypothetical protein n=1 Tax=Paludisphaera sp. TaxID=2017432 RepID=UPI00301E266C